MLGDQILGANSTRQSSCYAMFARAARGIFYAERRILPPLDPDFECLGGTKRAHEAANARSPHVGLEQGIRNLGNGQHLTLNCRSRRAHVRQRSVLCPSQLQTRAIGSRSRTCTCTRARVRYFRF